MTRLAILASHPIQYHGPLYRELARRVDLEVLFAHRASPAEQARAGFGVAFEWDIDITSGYRHRFLENVSRVPGTDRFLGCDTPGIGAAIDAGSFQALTVLGWHLKSYLQAIFAAKRRGIPVLVRGDSQLATPRSSLKRAAKGIAFPTLLRVFDAALYVGSRSRQYYLHFGYPESRLFSSPHCVDTDWFAKRASDLERASVRARLGISDEVTLVLFAGKLVPYKRPLDLIMAVAKCRAAGRAIEVLVAGDGPMRATMIARAQDLDVPLHMLGFQNQSQMPSVYAAADLLVLPSDERETWGLVANEALASGRAVIVSDACGCAADVTRDNRAGFSFPKGDICALASAVEKLSETPPSSSDFAERVEAHSVRAAVDGFTSALAVIDRRLTCGG